MMETNPRTTELIKKLFDGGHSVYAVLDGARSQRIHRLVGASGRAYRALYDGDLSAGLREVSPYVVELEARHAFTRTLLEQAWGQSWGTFVAAPLGLDAVRRHLRRFLRVQSEDGRPLLFRYYDPRVLRLYLPTCTAAELETFFGQIVRFVAEDANQQVALVFERGINGLSAARVELPAAPPPLEIDDEAEKAAAAIAASLTALPDRTS